MTPTLEERLTRYAAQLDDAARAHVPSTLPDGARRGRGRRVLVAALAVAAALAIALVIALANRAPHRADIAPATVATAVTTTPPTHTPPTTQPAPTTTANSTTTTPPVVGTRQVRYQPFVGNAIDPRLHVTANVSGSCVPSGAGTGFRCFATGGSIYDPCFVGPDGGAQPLVCPSDPSTVDVVELSPTSPIGTPPSQGPVRPWAVQLAGGQVCELVSAAWGGLGPYSCNSSTAAPHVADCHEPVAATPWWSADCQDRLSDASPFTSERVITLWY